MNILLVCNKIPFPPRDGGSLASYNMARGLVEAGNQIDLLAMNTSKHYSPDGLMDIDIHDLNKKRDVFIDNSINFFQLFFNLVFSSLPYNAECYIQKKFKVVLEEMLQEDMYDVVQLEGLYLIPYIKTIREYSNAIIVYRAHNIENIIWENYYKRERNLLKKWYFSEFYKRIRRFELEYINSYDILVTITNKDLDVLNHMGNEKPAMVAPFGIYPDELPGKNVSGRIDFCLQYIGALDWLPNLEALEWFISKIWVVLKLKYPRLIFRVAGRNAKVSYIKYLKSNGVDFMGEVESSRDFLSQSGILVVPLFSGSGIRVRVIEAMNMGKPMILTSYAISGIPAENGKQLILADDEHSFAKSVELLLAEPEYALRLGRGARDLSCKLYDNRRITNELSSFYKDNLL